MRISGFGQLLHRLGLSLLRLHFFQIIAYAHFFAQARGLQPSIGHRNTLAAFHNRSLQVSPAACG